MYSQLIFFLLKYFPGYIFANHKINRCSVVGMASESMLPTGREKVRLETAEAEILKLQGDFVALREDNVALMTTNESLRDKVRGD